MSGRQLRYSWWLRSIAAGVVVLCCSCGGNPPSTATFISPVFGDPCAHVDCSGQGTCSAGASQTGPICACNTAYAGALCEHCDRGFHRDADMHCVPDRLCEDQSPNPCGTHGSCTDPEGVIFCACDDGYEGPRCTLCAPGYGLDAADECLQKVLANGKTMTLPAACQPESCSNHGECSEVDQDIACSCYPGYQGGHCEDCSLGYQRPAGIDRCEPSSGCTAPMCGGCVAFDGARNFPDHPDTCNSSRQLKLDDLTLSSTGGEGTLWLCAQSTRYPLSSEHVAVEAGSSQPARLEFSKMIDHLTLDYVAWEAFPIEVFGDDRSVFKANLERYAKGTLDLSFDPPVALVAIRSDDVYSHSVALDDIVYSAAPDQCP